MMQMNDDRFDRTCASNTFMRDTRIKQSCQMYMSKRNRIVRNANATNAIATTNANVVVDDATRIERERVAKIDATLKTLRDVQSRDDKRDASNVKMQKRIRRNLRKMGYYISRQHRDDVVNVA